MTDEFLKIVDSRIGQVVKGLPLINTLPCRIVEIEQSGDVVVELVTDGSRYTLPNFAGSYLDVGENALVYYRGEIIGSNAYVGAALYKGDTVDSTVKIFNMSNRIGLLDRTVSSIDIIALRDTTISIVFNGQIQSSELGTCTATVYVDDVAQSYSPVLNINANSNNIACLNVPAFILEGEHTISVALAGVGAVVQICAFISGQFIEEQPNEETTDDDYIYITDEDGTNVLYYIGESVHPRIPDIINEKAVKNLCATSFNHSNIEAVYIPDGVIEIG